MDKFWNEPDYFNGTAHGLATHAERNSRKAWCGYVEVPAVHVLFGKDYDSRWLVDRSALELGKLGPIAVLCEAMRFDDGAASLDVILDVHGGITFARPAYWTEPRGWWLGFDCSHSGDASPYDQYRSTFLRDKGTYRDLDYVKAEIESLARQIANFNLKELTPCTSS